VSDHDNDIDALFQVLAHVRGTYEHRATLYALVAERDGLVSENILMKQRYTDALRQIDRLRERGITAHQFADTNTLDAIESWMNAVTGMLCNHEMPHLTPMKDELVSRRDAAIAAMRKGVQDGK
jgi:hypothetical protein